MVAHHPEVAVRQQLQRYADALDDLHLCMRVPLTAANAVAYQRLPLDVGVTESLVGKTVIEFPTVHVVLPEAVERYPEYTRWPGKRTKEEGGGQESADEREGVVEGVAGTDRPDSEGVRLREREGKGIAMGEEPRQRNNRVEADTSLFKRWT